MNPRIDSWVYERCAHCHHFVQPNPDAEWDDVAAYLHLDDGEVEHDHDAEPGESNTLAWWKTFRSELFETYPDGKIGPNSFYFRLAVRIYDILVKPKNLPTLTVEDIVKALKQDPTLHMEARDELSSMWNG